MRRDILAVALVLPTVLGAGGCAGRPLADNPVFLQAAVPPTGPISNPCFLAAGPPEYAAVFEGVLTTLDDYFEIEYANRYDGTIRTHPLIAPGFDQPWKPGSPDGAERLLATVQTIRYRCVVNIQMVQSDPAQPAAAPGYMVQVVVFKELEDLPRPIKATAGAAAFRSDNTVERQFEVVDPSVVDTAWIPKGREMYLEQEIIKRMKENVKKCIKNG
jgi:hypothetical protein